MCVCMLLCRVRLFAAPWTVARQASLFMGFSRQEYWSCLPFAPPDLLDQGMEPTSPSLASRFFTTWEAPLCGRSYELFIHNFIKMIA